MSIQDRGQLRPEYPVFSQRGNVAVPHPFGPPDVRPSGLGPGYSVYASAHGRNLAGMNESNFDNVNAEGIESYPNELDLLSEFDDTNGNGVFDPNDSHGNVHPEEGIFQDHVNLPGYIVRDKFYAPSEVRDLTRPDGYDMFVPGGAVAFQQGQRETFNKNQLLWSIPPSLSPVPMPSPGGQSIVDAPTATYPVGATNGGEDAEKAKQMQYYLLAAGVGLAVGVAYIVFRSKR